ncbi:hypothetical protein [Carnimonas bestiolae]|uniref:hypothetical protein n=1 Tax=Carnimonas bestiolae TaxID=3402172 RepID=UPI003EDC67C8
MNNGIEAIAAERRRQIEVHGYDAEHDAKSDSFAIYEASMSYMFAAWALLTGKGCAVDAPPSWPWDEHHWKPSEDPRRNLEKAGALIAAAIDRLDAEE